MKTALDDYLDVLITVLRNRPPKERERDVDEIRAHLEDLIADRESEGLEHSAAIAAAVRQFDAAQTVPDDLLAAALRSRIRHLPPLVNAVLYGFASSAVVGLPIWLLYTAITAHQPHLGHRNAHTPFLVLLVQMAKRPAFAVGVASLWFLLATQGWRRAVLQAWQWDTQWGTAVLWSLSAIPGDVISQSAMFLWWPTHDGSSGNYVVASVAAFVALTTAWILTFLIAARPNVRPDAYLGILINVAAFTSIEIALSWAGIFADTQKPMFAVDVHNALANVVDAAMWHLVGALPVTAAVIAGILLRRRLNSRAGRS